MPALDLDTFGPLDGVALGLLLGALAGFVLARRLGRTRRAPGAPSGPRVPTEPPPTWRRIDYREGVTTGDEPAHRSISERARLVRTCIDLADRLRDDNPALWNRLNRGLDDIGVRTVAPDGERFDGERYDAVSSEPAGTPELDHVVARTERYGYVDHDQVLRRAEVVVYRGQEVGDAR